MGMTFAARQRRALPEIECLLCRTDPCLASKFAMFSRLAVDEEMPSAERVISGRALRRGGMTRVGQLPCRLHVLLRICSRDLTAADTSKGVSETARRRFAAGQLPASPQEKDSR
jgi:hypothetical protein